MPTITEESEGDFLTAPITEPDFEQLLDLDLSGLGQDGFGFGSAAEGASLGCPTHQPSA